MGTHAHVVVVGGRAGLADAAAARLDDLEQRWSRFLLDSEVSRCNALSGRTVPVSAETVRLVSAAVAGWQLSGGIFDPTVLTALCDAGYDRDFRDVGARAATLTPPSPKPAAGAADICWDDRELTVTLPAGVQFDPGGIGKGLAADIVTEELVAAGAQGALVSVGGDLRVRGEPPEGTTWSLAVTHAAHDGVELIRAGVSDGAIATSSRLQRRWTTRAGDAHHLIDPRTGAPAVTPLVAVTAVAGEGWWAEVVAKAVLVGGLRVDAGESRAAWLLKGAAADRVEYDTRLAAVAA